MLMVLADHQPPLNSRPRMASNNDHVSRARKRAVIIAATLLYLCYFFRFTFQMLNPTIYTLPTPNRGTDHRNVAVIIETRPLDNIVPLILHFSTVLGPNWPIIIFTSHDNTIPSSAPFQRALGNGGIEIRHLPPQIQFHVRDQVSEFLTSSWLWESLAPAPHILLFQADSILCASSPSRVEDFLHFDFVGAPIRADMGLGDEGMNGGLSLRNRTLMLEIVRRWSWKGEREGAADRSFPSVAYEDQWFYKKMVEMNGDARRDREGKERGVERVRLPTAEQAMRFSVETMWYDKPLGYHQVASWNGDRIKEIDAWCPEHRMASDEKLRNAGE